MEVLTPTGRPRFLPSQQRYTGGTMTRSSAISHHHRNQHEEHHSPPGFNGQSSPPSSAADTSIRDKTKLLQLAEKVHTKKGAAAAAPNYTKSFRTTITSAVGRGGNNKNESGSSTPTVRRTNSTMLSSSSSSSAPPPVARSSKVENYKNPKLYASFSSKSCSKLTKALIRSDPAKTNIEHLVNYKTTVSPPKGGRGEVGSVISHNKSVNGGGKKSSPSESDHHHGGGGGGGTLSSFITPLKALHASFHERSSKLGQTRSKLFSHHHNQHNRDGISGSNAKLLFGTHENLHSSSGGGSSSSSAEDILAAEIIPQSKHAVGRSNGSSHNNNRLAIITSTINNKNAIPSPSSSATPKQLQNGSSRGAATPVTPDFLEGFRNEKSSCKSRNQTNGHHNNHQINGQDKPRRNGHDQEISKANTNGFISNTPDILGGCLDLPKSVGNGMLMRNGTAHNNNARPSYNHTPIIPSREQNGHHKFQPVTNYNGQIKDVSQKRKNIVVRMSYEGEEENDFYREENKDVFNVADDQVDINGPILMSTVTPKTRQSVSDLLTVSNYCGEDEDGGHVVDVPVPTFSSFLANNNSNKGNNGHYSVGVGNHSLGGGRNVKTRGDGVVVKPPPRTTSILSSMSNSTGLLKKSSLSLATLEEQKSSLRLSHDNLGGEEHASELVQNGLSQIRESEDDDNPEGSGSLSWLQVKQSSASTTTAKGESDMNKMFDKLSLERAPASLSLIGVIDDEPPPRPTTAAPEGGGRSRRGICMDDVDASLRSGFESRPQTALLSDEYAQYLGYDYDNNDNARKVEQAQARLNVLQLGANANKVTDHDDDDKEKDDTFGEDVAGATGEKNMTMLAITTTSPSRYGSRMRNLTSIMKPQQGGKRFDANGKRLIQHSVSFRGTVEAPEGEGNKEKGLMNGNQVNHEDERSCARLAKLGLSESFNKFDRKRSRSLPKSFMSMRNGLRNVLPSQWTRDGLAFERLTDQEPNHHHHPERSPCLEEQEKQTEAAIKTEDNNKQRETVEAESASASVPPSSSSSEEAFKMRWHKLGSSSASFSDRRPKSFDYAQRKAWMKLYRDMEVSQASGNPSGGGSRLSRPLTKGSITHLHLQEPSSQDNCSGSVSSSNLQLDGSGAVGDPSDYEGQSAMMKSSGDVSSTSPSLFKRFSKTFSLRFGSGSNVSKQQPQNGHVGGEMHRKGKSSKGAIGSSPDLFNSRLEMDVSRDKVNGKMRKTNVKSVRGDKCQSGDSGIGMEETEPHHRQISNLRRIRSDYISPSVVALASSAIGVSPSLSSSAYTSRPQVNGSALAKLSLVEIPDHSWDENTSSSSPNGGSGSGTSDTASYEELVDAKLDGDDGFSSSDESHPHHHQQDESPSYYHSLPHRKRNKRRLKEQGSINSCGPGDTPQEDNSIRGKVVREIIHTEQNYVKTLNDIVQGFLNPCRARNDLFSSRTVQNIFSNIEEILRLHVKFLEALKSKVDPTFVSKSSVGAVFTSWADRFSLYSEYCCNNPISVATVRSLVQFPQYAEFFEACRRLQMMDKLPLHGFLLRPIQRICQYHLQLNELLKHTEESHTDHKAVVEALETMKSVANKINDTQRQFESLQEIIRFQNSIDGWEGHNLVDRNAVILRKGELVKVTHGRKHKEVFVAILNKDLIYCKKDFMKKSGYVFDGRIDLNLRMWVNIDSNEEDEFFGMVHNSWRIYSPERRAWILFTAPSPTEKRKWIGALEKTKEDIHVDPKLREMAVVTTALADSEIMSAGYAHGHHSNTLPKSNKKSKGKNHLTVTKVDSDAMLIEVGKLKRSTVYTATSSQPSQREGTSKFYV